MEFVQFAEIQKFLIEILIFVLITIMRPEKLEVCYVINVIEVLDIF